MLEGAMLFAASAVRRLESGDRAILSAPFVVRSRMGTEGPPASETMMIRAMKYGCHCGRPHAVWMKSASY